MADTALFDAWPERYEQWFQTPIGELVLKYESDLIQELLRPAAGELILDTGCGTGIFTNNFLDAGAGVVGLDISTPMLQLALRKAGKQDFSAVQGDMCCLPFANASFNKTVSITALEFVVDAKGAVAELFRVTRPGGVVVVATLNSLSPWAVRRQAKTQRGEHHILEGAHYRSGADLLACTKVRGVAKTAVHFAKDEEPDQAVKIEEEGQRRGLDTGAFVAVRWVKAK